MVAALGVIGATVLTTGAAAPSSTAAASSGGRIAALPASANASAFSAEDYIQIESLYGTGYAAPKSTTEKGAVASEAPSGKLRLSTVSAVKATASGICVDPSRTNSEGEITLSACRNDVSQGFYKQFTYPPGYIYLSGTNAYLFRYAGNPDLCLAGVELHESSLDLALQQCTGYGHTQYWYPVQTSSGLIIATLTYGRDGRAHLFCLDAARPDASYCGTTAGVEYGFKSSQYWGLRAGRF